MARQRTNETERARVVVAQEAARLIVDHGIRDYRLAKEKAAERLGLAGRGSLPGNAEVEAAVAGHLLLFGGDGYREQLQLQRVAALAAMEMLAEYSPRLVGPVLAGTADGNSAINLHVFTDSPESVALDLDTRGMSCKPYERRLKSRRSQVETFPGYAFKSSGFTVEATVFPIDGIRQAPLSPIDGKPMRRADAEVVRGLLGHPD